MSCCVAQGMREGNLGRVANPAFRQEYSLGPLSAKEWIINRLQTHDIGPYPSTKYHPHDHIHPSTATQTQHVWLLRDPPACTGDMIHALL